MRLSGPLPWRRVVMLPTKSRRTGYWNLWEWGRLLRRLFRVFSLRGNGRRSIFKAFYFLFWDVFLYLMYYCRTDSFLIQLYMYFYYDILGPICAHYKIPLDSFWVPSTDTQHTTTKWKKTSVRFLWHHPGNPRKIPGQLLWNPHYKRFSVSAPQYRKFQQLKKAWQPCPTECQEGYRSPFPRERSLNAALHCLSRAWIGTKKRREKEGKKKRGKILGFLRRVELGCARLFWEWCLVCLNSTIYAALTTE